MVGGDHVEARPLGHLAGQQRMHAARLSVVAVRASLDDTYEWLTASCSSLQAPRHHAQVLGSYVMAWSSVRASSAQPLPPPMSTWLGNRSKDARHRDCAEQWDLLVPWSHHHSVIKRAALAREPAGQKDHTRVAHMNH